ncbi:CDP-diacylglycerol--glycerol-3-phosphate 3-phosphatidyltransferase [Deferribacterales bacterium RsTz2092]|nr:CDP-diacylglycerol--glycerol-3-phosphate 3-phosphatidyltransferase [Deferribacterales bacterium]
MGNIFNAPNVITLCRLVGIPIYLALMYAGFPYSNLLATILWTLFALTDLLDGWLARKYKLVTNFGKIIDPVADKIYVAAAMIALVDMHKLAVYVPILMLFRDFAVGALRDLAASKGVIIAADKWGKFKTLLQNIAIGFIIFYDSLVIYPFKMFDIYSAGSSGGFYVPAFITGTVLIHVALVASLFSGFNYFRRYFKLLG